MEAHRLPSLIASLLMMQTQVFLISMTEPLVMSFSYRRRLLKGCRIGPHYIHDGDPRTKVSMIVDYIKDVGQVNDSWISITPSSLGMCLHRVI